MFLEIVFFVTLTKIKDLLRSVLYIKIFKDGNGGGCRMALWTPASCVQHGDTEPQKASGREHLNQALLEGGTK